MPTPTILVAEDEDNDFFLLDYAFRKQGEKVGLVRVKDGVEAISYLAGTDGFSDRKRFPLPELVILDLKMPRKDGFEVLEWLKGKTPLNSLVSVVLSSSKQERDVNRAFALGANSYLTKPNDSAGFAEMTQIIYQYWFNWSQRPQL